MQSDVESAAPQRPRPRPPPAPEKRDCDDDDCEIDALMTAEFTHEYPSASAPAEVISAEEAQRRAQRAQTARPFHSPDDAVDLAKVGREERTAKVLDLFERAATPIGTVERAQAAIAAARAANSTGIFTVQPGVGGRNEDAEKQSVEESQAAAAESAKRNASSSGASESTVPSDYAAQNAANLNLNLQNMDPTTRVKAASAAASEDAAARAAMAMREYNKRAKKFNSEYYGGGGVGSGVATLGGGDLDHKRSRESSRETGGKDIDFSGDFWDWTPPEAPVDFTPQPGGSPTSASSYYPPKMQKKRLEFPTAPAVEREVMLMERAPERTLPQFQSVVEAQNAVLPEFQSVVESGSDEVSQLTSAMNLAAAPGAPAPMMAAPATAEQIAAGASIEASIEDALASAVRELGAGEGAEKEGVLSSGARWWREEGEDKLEGGKVMSWTCIRGTSADGAVEWEERWWKTSDSFTYRELGAVKSGRDSNGQAWQESWKEMYVHEVNKIPYIHREASKWSHTPKGAAWSEGWTEDYRADGTVDRFCEKTGALEDGAAPEDGHGNRWTEKWGEKWDGHGGCIKWTDTWASRDHSEGGMENAPGRSWGEKWEEKWGEGYNEHGRAGSRQGLTWDETMGQHTLKSWGEEHYPDGRLHKYGNSSDGSQYWDTWEDGAGGWWERNPSFGWIEALHHSPDLMNLPLQPRTGGGTGPAKGPNGRKIITPHRSRRGASGGGGAAKPPPPPPPPPPKVDMPPPPPPPPPM